MRSNESVESRINRLHDEITYLEHKRSYLTRDNKEHRNEGDIQRTIDTIKKLRAALIELTAGVSV